MRQLRRRQEPEQQELRFARQEIWMSLPAPQRERCHQLLVELLISVIRFESKQEEQHER